MKITLFTSNQPRHTSFIERLQKVASELHVVVENTTIFSGKLAGLHRQSETMEQYMNHVRAAETKVFGEPRAIGVSKTHLTLLQMGDLKYITLDQLAPALQSDFYLVFGASFIQGPLCDFLVSKKAVNSHMGVSPFFRGSSCNFWAIHDQRSDLVGATIHLLTKGLDSGDILFHALPSVQSQDPFELGMRAVEAAQIGITDRIQKNTLFEGAAVSQNRALEIRYSKGADFTDEIASSYLTRIKSDNQWKSQLQKRDLSQFIRPFYLS